MDLLSCWNREIGRSLFLHLSYRVMSLDERQCRLESDTRTSSGRCQLLKGVKDVGLKDVSAFWIFGIDSGMIYEVVYVDTGDNSVGADQAKVLFCLVNSGSFHELLRCGVAYDESKGHRVETTLTHQAR